MKVTAKVTVIDGERQASVELDVEAGAAYGQHPVLGATEKVLSLAPKVIEAALTGGAS